MTDLGLQGGRGFFRGLTALWCRDVPFYVAFFAVRHFWARFLPF